MGDGRWAMGEIGHRYRSSNSPIDAIDSIVVTGVAAERAVEVKLRVEREQIESWIGKVRLRHDDPVDTCERCSRIAEGAREVRHSLHGHAVQVEIQPALPGEDDVSRTCMLAQPGFRERVRRLRETLTESPG